MQETQYYKFFVSICTRSLFCRTLCMKKVTQQNTEHYLNIQFSFDNQSNPVDTCCMNIRVKMNRFTQVIASHPLRRGAEQNRLYRYQICLSLNAGNLDAIVLNPRLSTYDRQLVADLTCKHYSFQVSATRQQ